MNTNCPNCKKDLVLGTDCPQCRAILATQPAPIEETIVEKVKKAVKRKITKTKK